MPELSTTRTPAPPFAPLSIDREQRRLEGLVMVGLPTLATWLCLGGLYPLDEGFFASAGTALAVSLAAALLFDRRRYGTASLWAGILASAPAWAWLFEERLRAHFFAFWWLGRRDDNAAGATSEHAVVAGLFAAVTIAVTVRVAPRCGARVRHVVASLASVGCLAAGLLVAWGLVRHARAPSFEGGAWDAFAPGAGAGACPPEGPCPPPPWAKRMPCGAHQAFADGSSIDVACSLERAPSSGARAERALVSTTMTRADGLRVYRSCDPAEPRVCQESICPPPRPGEAPPRPDEERSLRDEALLSMATLPERESDGAPFAGGACISLSRWQREIALRPKGPIFSAYAMPVAFPLADPDLWRPRVDVMVADVLRLRAPPWLWLASGGLGLGLALRALRRRARLEAWLEALRRGKPAKAKGDGWAHPYDGSEPYRLPADAGPLSGPLVLFLSEKPSGYRGHAQGDLVSIVPGQPSELRAKVEAEALASLMQAGGALALASAPLVAWVALVRGV